MIFIIALSIVGFIGILAEMFTYKVGEGGIIAHFCRRLKGINLGIALGIAISGWTMWKGSTLIAIVAGVVFVTLSITGVVRVDRRLNQNET